MGKSDVLEMRLLTADEVCEITGLGKSTLYKYVCERKIASMKIGRHLRFQRRDVDAFIDSCRREAV